MAALTPTHLNMRIYHRYLGFFLVGVMAMYALSGMILIFRDKDFLKQEKQVSKQVAANADPEQLGKLLQMRQPKIQKQEGDMVYFENGTYNKSTGAVEYKVKEYPYLVEKMTHLHKARTADPLFFFNIFFAVSLLFFVISSFWMFTPDTAIFKKGLYFTIGGVVLVLILLLV